MNIAEYEKLLEIPKVKTEREEHLENPEIGDMYVPTFDRYLNKTTFPGEDKIEIMLITEDGIFYKWYGNRQSAELIFLFERNWFHDWTFVGNKFKKNRK